MFKISLLELKGWFEGRASIILGLTNRKVLKLYDEVKDVSMDLRKVCEDFLRKCDKDLREKRSDPVMFKAARAGLRLGQGVLKAVDRVKVPEEVSFKDVKDLIGSVEEAVEAMGRERDGWHRELRSMYMFDVWKINGSIGRLNKILEELRSLISSEGERIKAVEGARLMVEELLKLSKDVDLLREDVLKESDRLMKVKDMLKRCEEEVEELSRNKLLAGLRSVEDRLRRNEQSLTETLQQLSKPLKKFLKEAEEGVCQAPPELRKLVLSYLENPFETFLKEGEGYPRLKEVLKNIKQSMLEDKLRLKRRVIDKAISQINRVVDEDSLTPLYDESHKLLEEIKIRMMDEEARRLKEREEEVKKVLEALKATSFESEARIVKINKEIKDHLRRIDEAKKTLKNEIFKITGENIEIIGEKPSEA